jgi:hypothetical protein
LNSANSFSALVISSNYQLFALMRVALLREPVFKFRSDPHQNVSGMNDHASHECVDFADRG